MPMSLAIRPVAIYIFAFCFLLFFFPFVESGISPGFFFYLVLSLLPYLCLVGTIWLARLTAPDKPFFMAMLYGSLIWSVAIWAQTNILSFFNLINGAIISAFWLVWAIPLAIALWRRKKDWRKPIIRGWDWAPAAIAACAFIVALAYPPNNYDVLSYHMPRVAQWLQNGSLAPYPTGVDRQIGMAPFNALVALQSYAPGRLDYYVNLGQWLAYIGCVVATCELAKELGGSERARWGAVIFAATLPPAITQASNTESCLLVTFFLCLMAWVWVKWWREKGRAYKWGALFGPLLGFAILSKGSAYPIAFPFVCVIAWLCLRHPKKNLVAGILAATLVIALNAPHLYRAYSGEGNLFAGGDRNILLHPAPQTFLNNVVYNFVSNHPVLLSRGGAEKLEKFSEKIGIRQDDLTLFPFGGLSQALHYYSAMDSYSPIIGQSILIIFVFLGAALKKFPAPPIYLSCVFAGFVLFCLALTWHAWVPRIQMPLFFLAAPVAGEFIASIKIRFLGAAILAGLCALAVPFVFLLSERPLLPTRDNIATSHFMGVPRETLLLYNYSNYRKAYVEAVDYLAAKNPDRAGINFGTNGMEYPLWRMLRHRLEEPPRLDWVLPNQKSYPRYVFEFERVELAPPATPPRVLEYENGEVKSVFQRQNDNQD